jgi:micrococcal nuclease
MNRIYKTILIIIVIIIGLALIVPDKKSDVQSQSTPANTAIPTVKPTEIKKEFYKVTKVIDGDTINVDVNGKSETIRLIGIDSPETVDPRKPVQCFGKEASDKAKETLTGKDVSLEIDPTQGERDKYNRLLRFVFLEDGTNFNKFMISEGYAHEYTYQSNPYKYQKEFKDAQKSAMENKKGLWADGVCLLTPTPTAQLAPTNSNQAESQNLQLIQPTSAVVSGKNYVCDCSKTCTQISSCDEAYFQLNSCDCKTRDNDGDGVPCESLCR